MVSWSGRALAVSCGGAKLCRCGDKVVRDYRLTADLGPCPENGLRLSAKVMFDGAGYAIRGSSTKDTVGLQVPEAAGGSQVQNVTVTGFERGIRLHGVENVQLTNVVAHHNGDTRTRVGYGIDVAGGSSGNRIERAQVHDNADEGIHFGTNARANRLTRSKVYDNSRENVYFLEAVEDVVDDCDLEGGGNASVYVKHSKSITVSNTRIRGRPVVVRGASSGTRLIDDTLSEAGIVVQPYDDKKLGTTRPVQTTVRGGRIAAPQACVRVDGASETTLEDVKTQCPDVLVVDGGSTVTLVGLPTERVRCAGPGVVREGRAVEVEFVDEKSRPVPSVRIAADEDGSSPIGAADAKGRFQGAVPVATFACPGLVRRPAGPLRVSSGDTSRTLTASELSGRVLLKPGDAAARGGDPAEGSGTTP